MDLQSGSTPSCCRGASPLPWGLASKYRRALFRRDRSDQIHREPVACLDRQLPIFDDFPPVFDPASVNVVSVVLTGNEWRRDEPTKATPLRHPDSLECKHGACRKQHVDGGARRQRSCRAIDQDWTRRKVVSASMVPTELPALLRRQVGRTCGPMAPKGQSIRPEELSKRPNLKLNLREGMGREMTN